MLFGHMYHKLGTKATDSHSSDIGVRNDPFDPAEQTHEGIIRQNIIQIPISQQQDSLLFLIDMIDLDQFS